MKTTWEKLYKKALKENIETLSLAQKSLKQQKRDLKNNRKQIILENIKSGKSRYHGIDQCKYTLQMIQLSNSIQRNKIAITTYLSELNKINGKENSNALTKKEYYLDSNLKEIEYKTHILCFDYDSFAVYETTAMTEKGFKYIDYLETESFISFDKILKIGSKEEMDNELSKIKEKIENSESYISFKAQHAEKRDLQRKKTEREKRFERKLKKLQEEFEQKEQASKDKINELIKNTDELRDTLKQEKLDLFKELKNAE